MDLYPGSMHFHDVGLGGADDSDVWNHAKAHSFAIVSKGSDFAERSVFESEPPKVVWVRAGNCTTQVIASWLRSGHRKTQRPVGCWT